MEIKCKNTQMLNVHVPDSYCYQSFVRVNLTKALW